MIQIIKSNESPRGRIDYGVAWKQSGLHQLCCNTGGGDQKFLSGSFHVSKKKPLPLVIKQIGLDSHTSIIMLAKGLHSHLSPNCPQVPGPGTHQHHTSVQEAGLLGFITHSCLRVRRLWTYTENRRRFLFCSGTVGWPWGHKRDISFGFYLLRLCDGRSTRGHQQDVPGSSISCLSTPLLWCQGSHSSLGYEDQQGTLS